MKRRDAVWIAGIWGVLLLATTVATLLRDDEPYQAPGDVIEAAGTKTHGSDGGR